MRNPNGYGSVYRMKGNRRKPYIAAVTIVVDEEKKRKALGYYATRRDALAALAAYHNQPYDIAAREVTVEEFFKKWIAWREERGKGPSATITYKSTFQNHCKPLYNKKFVDIQSIHIQQLIDKTTSPVIATRIKLVWGLLYKYAALTGITHQNAAAITERPSIPKSRKHRPFSDDELLELWQMQDKTDAALALIYCYTGLRPSELLTIKTENVFIDERYMIGGLKTEAGKERKIPIAEKILPLIQRFYAVADDNLIALNYSELLNLWRNSPIPAIRNHLPHDGRHTCETMLDNAGVNKRTIQIIIGHAGRDVDENTYTHKTLQQLIDAINQI